MAKLDIIRASAGSGKTYKLAYFYIKKLILQPEAFHEILAVTFTNKATCQMKDRILENLQNLKADPSGNDYILDLTKETGFSIQEIQSRAAKAQIEILADYNRFSVSTIDKFFTKIVRSFFNELHKDPSYEVVISTSELLDQAILDVILDADNEKLLEPIFNDRIENEKNFDIKKDIDKIKSIILSSHSTNNYAGLKDRYYKDRKEVDKLKDKIVAAASQMAGYMFKDGIDVSDYIYGKNGFANNIKDISLGITIEAKTRLRTLANLKDFGPKSKHKDYIKSIESRILDDSETLIKAIDLYEIKHNSTELIESNINLIEVIKVIFDRYKKNCERDHIVTINEMPEIVSDISRNESLDFLYMKIDARLRSIMIDEFQDTSIEQWAGFKPILEEICSYLQDDQSFNLIIGDLKQAIYRWRGGNEALLRKNVKEEFPDYVREDKLDRNYRSKENIISFNNMLFEHIKETGIAGITFEGKEEIQERTNKLIKETYSDYFQFQGKDNKGGYVQYKTIGKEDSVPEQVISIIKDLEGYEFRDVAVIVRNNKDSYDIADAFSKSGIPFISGESLSLSKSKIVQQFITLLHISLSTDDVLRIASYNLSVGKEIKDSLSDEQKEILSSVSSMSLLQAATVILEKFIPQDTSNETAFLDAFLNLMYEKQTKDDMSVPEFLAWWDESGNKTMLSSPEGQNAVTIITIHKAKGLEYPVVIAPRMNWNLFGKSSLKYMTADLGSGYEDFGYIPVALNKKCYNSIFKNSYLDEREQEIIDNLNLLYVLTTRAKDRLYMISQDTASNKISSILSPILTDNFEYGEKSPNEEQKKIEKDNKDVIQNINPVKFNRALSKTSEGNHDDKNLLQGILMHEVLSSIKSLDELHDAVRKQCEVESLDFDQFIPIIDKIMSCKEMKIWFSSEWKSYNERGILIPKVKFQKRPDRVIVNGDKATVIDYKFGTRKLDKYIDQVNQYMSLVRQIGYTDVSGYIYYVNLNEIVEC